MNKTNSTVSDVTSLTKDLSINSGISSSSLLTTLGFKAKDTSTNESGVISFTLTNGTTSSPVSLTVNSSSTVKDLMDAVNSATSGAVTMNIDDTTGKVSFESKGYGSSSNISIADTSTGNNSISNLGISLDNYTGTTNKGTAATKMVDLGFSAGDMKFSVNGTAVSLTVDNTTTMQTLIDKINTATSGAVTMNIDGSGKISFNSPVKISDVGTGNNIIDKLKLTQASDIGTDAIVDITAPGQSKVTTTQSSNNFTIDGVDYNLVGVNTAGDTSNVTVTANADTVVTNIKSFVADYNTLITNINTKLTEKKNSDYAPLTDDQKENMSAAQITAWETKAKVGILRNDDYLSSLLTQVRGLFSTPVYSNYDSKDETSGKISLSFGQYGTGAIGIDTSSDTTDGGKLVIKNETKLKSAIENNLQDFQKLFIGTSDYKLKTNETYIGSEKYKEDGLYTRMDSILRDYVAAPGLGSDGTYSLSGTMNIFVNKQYDYSTYGSSGKNTLPDQVYSKNVSIKKFKTQLSDAQTRYYAKFTALETAMNALNSQQSSLSSMLGTS